MTTPHLTFFLVVYRKTFTELSFLDFLTHYHANSHSQNFASCLAPIEKYRPLQAGILTSLLSQRTAEADLPPFHSVRQSGLVSKPVRWWGFETECHESAALSRMSKAAWDSFRWRQHMLLLHPWQENFKQRLPWRHFPSPFKVISQLSGGGHSDISIVHRHGKPIKVV